MADMTRREMLVRMLGAATAAAVAPLIDLTDATPAFWNQPALRQVMPWRITFPDGASWTFDAEVIAERVTEEGIDLTVRPRGEMKLEQVEVPEVVEDASIVGPNGEPSGYVVPSMGTLIHREGKPTMELMEIDLPRLERYHDDRIPGLVKRGTVTFMVKPI